MKTSTIVLLLVGVGAVAYVAYQQGRVSGAQTAGSTLNALQSFTNSFL